MQYKIGNYLVDFYLPKYNLTIQCDGCWAHNHKCRYNKYKKKYPRQLFQQVRDKACLAYHEYRKINLVRFKGCDILERPEVVKDNILFILERIENGELIHEC